MNKRTFLKTVAAGLAVISPLTTATKLLVEETSLPLAAIRDLFAVVPLQEPGGLIIYMRVLPSQRRDDEYTFSIVRSFVDTRASVPRVDALDALLDHSLPFARCSDDPQLFMSEVVRAGNDIARCTRRGTGNTILVHPKNFPLIEKLQLNRWTILQHRDHRLDNKVIVGYKNQTDFGKFDSSIISVTENEQGGNIMFVTEAPSYFRTLTV